MQSMEQFLGLASAPLIRALVERVKPTWSSSKNAEIYTVLSSLIFGVILNLPLSFLTGNSLMTGIAFGIVSGLLSNIWNVFVDIAKG